MTCIFELPNDKDEFTLTFMAYDSPSALSPKKDWTDREGVIELTYNHPKKDAPAFEANNGNGEKHRGFGHVCISVDNIQAACARIENANPETLGMEPKFQKKLSQGTMRNIAFVLDPDGYWVEIVSFNKIDDTEHITKTELTTYRMVCRRQSTLRGR